MKEARKAESTSPLAHEGATPVESLSLRSWCYSSATMATTSWKYGAAGRTGDQRAEDGGFKLQREECCDLEFQRVPLLVPEGRF